MPLEPATLIKDDQEHWIHPLHHPSEHLEPLLLVRGRGAVITDIQGREYIDGLAGLWNVNVGHGREELAQAAAQQMSDDRTQEVRDLLPAVQQAGCFRWKRTFPYRKRPQPLI